jgi:hypothetical protein
MSRITHELAEDPGRGIVAIIYVDGALWQQGRFTDKPRAEKWVKQQRKGLRRQLARKP